jgi:hypothetical protein
VIRGIQRSGKEVSFARCWIRIRVVVEELVAERLALIRIVERIGAFEPPGTPPLLLRPRRSNSLSFYFASFATWLAAATWHGGGSA